jgi:hypothetical protein
MLKDRRRLAAAALVFVLAVAGCGRTTPTITPVPDASASGTTGWVTGTTPRPATAGTTWSATTST